MLVKLKDIGDIIIGKTPKTSKKENYSSNEICFITTEDLKNGFKITHTNRYISKIGFEEIKNNSINGTSVIVSCVGSDMGNVGFTDMTCATNQQLYSITNINSNYNPYYIYYVLKLKKNYFRQIAGNTAMPILPKLDFENITIDLPPLEIQKKIASILSSIDNQIERNNLMVKKLQVLSQGIFNKFFSNETNHISLLDFPYIQIIKPGIDRFKGNKHYIATAEVDNDKINYNAPLIEYDTRENRANMQPVKNSVWFAKMKTSIKHIYVSDADSMFCSNYIFSTGFAGIKCEDIAFEYLIDFINTPYFEMKKDILSHGATMEGVNNDDLKSIQISLPSKDKLIKFHNNVKKIHYQITMLNEQTFKLNNLKEKLLPLLINQQLS